MGPASGSPPPFTHQLPLLVQVHVPRVRPGAAQADQQVPNLPQPGGQAA